MKQLFLLFSFVLFLAIGNATAQDWESISPELKTLYNEANKAIQQKDYNKAITLYHQAIRLQPNNVVLRRDLAYTHYLAGNFKEGLEVLKPVMQSNETDPETYQLAAALENASGNKKRAARLLDEGLKTHPNSGLMYFAKGSLELNSTSKKSNQLALRYFVRGIEKEPAYANNYLSASKSLVELNEYPWAVIYAEIFINLEPESMKTNEGKKLLLNAYKQLFTAQKSGDLPGFQTSKSKKKSSFIDAFQVVNINNYVVLADAFTVENLILLRTRVLLDWYTKYPLSDHSLFLYQDYMIKNGYFDAYNQFLFGAISDSQAYSNWVKSNSKEFQAFGNYFKNGPYRPSSNDPQFEF